MKCVKGFILVIFKRVPLSIVGIHMIGVRKNNGAIIIETEWEKSRNLAPIMPRKSDAATAVKITINIPGINNNCIDGNGGGYSINTIIITTKLCR